MSVVSEHEDWLRHIEDQLAALGNGTVKQYKRFRESLEGKDFEGRERKFDAAGNPVFSPNEGHNRQPLSPKPAEEQSK